MYVGLNPMNHCCLAFDGQVRWGRQDQFTSAQVITAGLYISKGRRGTDNYSRENTAHCVALDELNPSSSWWLVGQSMHYWGSGAVRTISE